MLILIPFLILGVITSRIIAKHFKLASIVYSIFFVYIDIYLLILCDEPFIVTFIKNIIGSAEYDTFKYALTTTSKYNLLGTNVLMTIQLFVLVGFTIVLIYGLVKAFEETVEVVKILKLRPVNIFNYIVKSVSKENKTNLKRYHLTICKMQN